MERNILAQGSIAGMKLSRQSTPPHPVTRRTFGRHLALAAGGALWPRRQEPADEQESLVTLAQGSDRTAAIEKTIESLGGIDCQGLDVFIKGNYSSPHPFPATTHAEALGCVAGILRKKGCRAITLVERSAMGTATDVWRKLGVDDIARRLEINLLSLDDLPPDGWRHETMPDSHWKHGVEIPKFINPDSIWIQICNLKAHRFGARFSASLKNTLGLIAKRSCSDGRHNYMVELHASPDQRIMIAEVNRLYRPSLIVMDAMSVFTDGGPESGEVASPQVVVASRDRVAIDAVGLALLRLQTPETAFKSSPVFEDDQVKHAAELGLGAKSPDMIRIETSDQPSRNLAYQIKAMLASTAGSKNHPSAG